MEDLEIRVLEIVQKKHSDSGGNNGNGFGDFDHILKMSIDDRNVFLKKMVEKNLIVIRQGSNINMVMLPKFLPKKN